MAWLASEVLVSQSEAVPIAMHSFYNAQRMDATRSHTATCPLVEFAAATPAVTMDVPMQRGASETDAGRRGAAQQSGAHTHGIYRAHAPTAIQLSPVRPGRTSLVPSPSPSREVTTPTGSAGAPHAAYSPPPLVSANELPDDPEKASHVMHLFAPPLAPAWSPAPMSRSQSARTDDMSPQWRAALSPSMRSLADRGGLSPVQGQQRLHTPCSPSMHGYFAGMHRTSSRQRSPDTSHIFERDIELLGSPHMRTPKEAIDVAVPPVLDDAADAIVGDSTLEIVSPRESASPYGSPDARSPWRRATGGAMGVGGMTPGSEGLRGAWHDGAHPKRMHGHRRLRSEQSNVVTSMPSSPASQRRSLVYPPTPGAAPASSAHSPSLSIDGAVIPEGQAATFTHSLDGMADAVVQPRTAASPSSPSHMPTSGSYFSLNDARFRYSLVNDVPSHTSSRPGALGAGTGAGAGAGASASASASASGPVPGPRSPRGLQASLSTDAPSPARLQVPHATPMQPSASTGSERKRLSWLSYADIVNDAHEYVHDIDPRV